MKSNLNESPYKIYSKIPKYWEGRSNMINYDKADESIHYEDGWRNVIVPIHNSVIEKLGSLYYDEINDIITYEVLDKTDGQIQQELKLTIPSTITPAQGRIQLSRLGLLTTVEEFINLSDDIELKLYWEYSLSWDIDNSYVMDIINYLGMDETSLYDFFLKASNIN